MSEFKQTDLFSPALHSSTDLLAFGSPCEGVRTEITAPSAEPLVGTPEARSSTKPARALKPDIKGGGEDERFLSVQDVASRYAVSVATIWRHTKDNPAFPKPLKILNGSTRWRLSEILVYEAAREGAVR